MTNQRVTVPDLHALKTRGQKIVMVTAYDATFAALFDEAGVEVLLVGDSLGMVVQGHANTLPVTLDQMVYHTAAVCRGARRAHVVGDLPFMSYQVSPKQALASAGRLMQEGGAHSVKLEGGEQVTAQVEKIVSAGIPVMGHIGLTPQSVHAMGGFKVQGKDALAARRLLADARALADAGAYALVLEGIPAQLAAEITGRLKIPTIGIGAGAGCDGQVLVSYDLLGMNAAFKPKFVKHYATLHEHITTAARAFADEVRAGKFPDDEHSFHSQTLHLVRPSDEEAPDKVYGVPV